MSRRSARLRSRLFIAALSLAMALGGLELALRAQFPVLPSLAPLAEEGVEIALYRPPWATSYYEPKPSPALCYDGPDGFPSGREGRDGVFGQGRPRLQAWFVGDSVTAGFGVGREEDFGSQFAQLQPGVVELKNMGIPGAGSCPPLQELHRWLNTVAGTEEEPDLVVLQLFGDDLERRAQVLVQGQVVAFPEMARPAAVRWMVLRSWLANYVWFETQARVGNPERFIAPEHQQEWADALAFAAKRVDEIGARFVVVALEPAGEPLCEGVTDPDHECLWMADDLALMIGIAQKSGLEVVDLRGLWDGTDELLETEQAKWEESGRLPVHPNAAGHARIAKALDTALKR